MATSIQNLFDHLFPNTTLAARETLLWFSPFPFVDIETIESFLRDAQIKYGYDISAVLNGLDAEFHREFKELYRRQNGNFQ